MGSLRSKKLPPFQRRQQILNIVRERERVAVDELARETAASSETIRRDLNQLQAGGFLQKVHGGAVVPQLTATTSNVEGSFHARMRLNMHRKRAIARCATALFSPGDTMFIDTGTTTLVFAEELARLSQLTIVTNSAAIAQYISRGSKDSRIFLLGGEYRSDAAENLGRLTVEQISHFRCNHAVLTVGAIDSSSVTDYDLQEAEVATAMVRNAQRVTILADSSKMGRAGLFSVCGLSEIRNLVTDKPPSGSIREALQSSSVRTLVADHSGQDAAFGAEA